MATEYTGRGDSHPAAGGMTPHRSPHSRRSVAAVGVDFGQDAIRLVKATLVRGRAPRIVAVASLEPPPGVSPQSPEFASWFGQALRGFCDPKGHCAVWTCLPHATRATVTHLRLPKVPKRQVGNAVFWALKREAPFEEAETVLDFDVEGTATLDGLPRIVVNAYAVPRSEVDDLRQLFARAGVHLTGITLSACVARNLVRAGWVKPPASGTLVFCHVDAEESRITIVSRGSVVLSRSLRSGVNSLVEPLLDGPDCPRTLAQARQVLAELSLDPSFDTQSVRTGPGGPGPADAAAAKKPGELVLPALKRLVANIERTLEYESGDLKAEGIDRLCVSGEIVAYKPVLDYIGAQLGCAMKVLDPFAGSHVAADVAVPESPGSAVLGQAAALALSESFPTANLLATQSERARAEATQSAQWWVVAIFVLLAAAALGANYGLGRALQRKQAERASLMERLAQAGPRVGLSDVEALALSARTEQARSAALCRDYQSLAVLGEVLAITPPAVRLLLLDADLSVVPGPPPAAPTVLPGQGGAARDGGPGAAGAATAPATSARLDSAAPPVPPSGGRPAVPTKTNSMTIEGVVPGDPQAALSHLAVFMHDLGRSQLLRDPQLEESTMDTGDGDSVLRFKLRVMVPGLVPAPAPAAGGPDGR